MISRTISKKTPSPTNKPVDQSEPQKKDMDIAQQPKTNDLPQPVLQNINQPAGNNNDITVVHNNIMNEDKAGNNINILDTYAVNTVFQDEESNSKSLTGFDDAEDDNKARKTKIGGFFKKVKRMVERTAKVNTGSGNNIKIANMSFAYAIIRLQLFQQRGRESIINKKQEMKQLFTIMALALYCSMAGARYYPGKSEN